MLKVLEYERTGKGIDGDRAIEKFFQFQQQIKDQSFEDQSLKRSVVELPYI